MARQHCREVFPLERLECFGVPEEARHSDEQIVVKRVDLVRVATQVLEVALVRILAVDVHTPQDAPADGFSPIPSEIDTGAIPDGDQNPVYGVRCVRDLAPTWDRQRRCFGNVALDYREL